MSDAPPADGSLERAAPQEMRVSHADRNDVVDALAAAAAEGRLTPGELDERVERALAARSAGELAVLTRDLPLQPLQPAKPAIPAADVVKVEKRFGNAEWTGTWQVPRRMEIRLTVGNARLDFTSAVITHDELSLDVDNGIGGGIGGEITLITKPGIVVTADDLFVGNHAELRIRPRAQDPDFPVALRIVVTGRMRGGWLKVRYPKGIR